MVPVQPERLTHGSANDQLLYFTSSSLTTDDQTLIFLSDRASEVPKAEDPRANVDLYALHRPSGDVRRLTEHRDGYLRSYVYFEGRPGRGFGVASPSLHAASGDVYYVHGDEVRCVNAHSGALRTLAKIPPDHVTGYTHVSDDNTRLCVPTIHESAFRDTTRIDATVQELGLVGHLRIFDTDTGAEVEDVEIERGWVTHVQFRPGDPQTVLFNHEWPADCGIRRIWLWDGRDIRRLRDEGANEGGELRRRDDWVCHEVWSRDGQAVIYHGSYAPGDGAYAGHAFLGRVDADGSNRSEIAFPAGFRRYGHFNVGTADTQLVGDGYAEYGPDGVLADEGTVAGATREPVSGQGEWISRLDVDWTSRSIVWTALCQHGTSWTSQDTHPHPILDHAGTEILFTSDRTGNRAVYAVPIGS